MHPTTIDQVFKQSISGAIMPNHLRRFHNEIEIQNEKITYTKLLVSKLQHEFSS